MPKRSIKPEAKLNLLVNNRRLIGERWHGKWVLACSDYPDISDRHNGCADASLAIEEFTDRALGKPEPVTVETLTEFNPPVTIFSTKGRGA